MHTKVSCAVMSVSLACLLSACATSPQNISSSEKTYDVAYLSDVHFHDIYAEFEDGAFKGLPSANGKDATIRTMYAQLTSTRLFNENYFAFLAALDDAVARGLKLVIISGDFSDDGQPIHMRGLQKVMDAYSQKFGVRFFVTFGNHDPVRPFAVPGGKSDYLGAGGKAQPIFSMNGTGSCAAYATPGASKDGTICTQEVLHGGYAEVFQFMGNYGLTPQAGYVYWETPYSSYRTQQDYTLDKARQEASLSRRSFEICKQGTGGTYKQAHYTDCTQTPDGSYLVEPVPGLWLMAIDANVYPPDQLSASTPAKQFAASSDQGWNAMVTHKQHVLTWMKDVAARAKREGKTLSVFSHYPTLPFYRGASPEIATMFGSKGLDLKREPTAVTSEKVAATGIGVHFGGHIHANDTAVYQQGGNFLVNIQTPSLAAYVPAYKQVSLHPEGKVDVRTVALKDVPRFDELFEHYRTERRYLEEAKSANLWDDGILRSRSYAEFASWHVAELTRLRFLKENWPCDMRAIVSNLNAADMLTMAVLETPLSEGDVQREGKDAAKLAACTSGGPATTAEAMLGRYEADWRAAQAKAAKLAAANGLTLEALRQIRGMDIAIDFHRVLNAGELAFADVAPRAALYRAFNTALNDRGASQIALAGDGKPATSNPAGRLFQARFAPLFHALAKAANGAPNRDFSVDLNRQIVSGRTEDRLRVE